MEIEKKETHFFVQDISPAKFKQKRAWKYRKSSALVIHEGGRYGTRWLRAIVFRMAKNLGMIGHDRSMTEEVKVTCIKVNGKIVDRFNKAIINVMNSTHYTPDELEIICGQNEFEEFMYEMKGQLIFDVKINVARRDDGYTCMWREIGVRIVPCVSGFAVIPKRSADQGAPIKW